MAFMQLIMTALKLQKLKKDLVEEKKDSIAVSKNLPSKKLHHIIKLRLKFNRLLKKTLACCFFERFCYALRHDGSCENYTIKSIAGFVSGFVLTYIFFMFFVFQLDFTLPTATVFCAILGCILMIGLAFSTKVRCVVLLTLPQFFSQKGRQALLAYAFILAMSGPSKNTLNNLGILSESLACGQEQLKQAVRQIIDVIKKPFLAIKEAIKKVVKTVKEIVKKIKEVLLTIKRIIMAIVKVIKAAFEFLAKIISICNKELGTPFERCSRVFENAIVDCNAKLGPLFNWLCSLAYIVQSVCYLVKFLDLICIIVDFINDSIIGVVIRKVKTFIRHIRTMFYVRIRFSHKFEFHTNTSKTMEQVAQAMVAEIKDRTAVLRAIFKFMTSAAAMFFIFIIFKVTYYRYRYLTSEKFDNKYINKDFQEIDMRRAKLGKETVLPLNDREKKVYVTVSSKNLAQSEKKALSKSISTLATASLKLAILMAADYCLYWMLNLIKYYGKFQSKVQAPNVPTVHISGKGFLADLLKSIVKAFQPVGIQLEIDTVPCLPTPIPPNYDRYVQIATVMLLCWLLALLEPYGLRLRHIVMCYYHPTRAKQRSIWLYNHIMRARNSFLKFARRQLKRKVLGDGSIAKITCKEYLAANFKICGLCLGENLQTCCLLCGDVFRESDNKKPIKCQTPDCPGIYCEQCFSDLQNLCTVCLSPIEYGDLSDINEEKDSSEEEPKIVTLLAPTKPKGKRKLNWRKCFICSICCRQCCPEDGDKDISKYSPEKKDDLYKDSSDEESTLLIPETPQITPDIKDTMDKTKDSDYYSSDSSTDYSYSYQYEKPKEPQPMPTQIPFKDLEKQEIPDYASMSSFREEEDEGQIEKPIMADKSTTPVNKQSVGTVISGTTMEEFKRGRKVDFTGASSRSKITVRKKKKPRKKEKPKTEEEQHLLEQTCSSSDTERDDRLKHLPSPVLKLLASSSSSMSLDNETFLTSTAVQTESLPAVVSSKHMDFSTLRRISIADDSTSSSSSDTDALCDCMHVVIPELNLASVTSTPRNYVNDIFGNVKYDEVSESSKSPSSDRQSASTDVSSLNEVPRAPSSKNTSEKAISTDMAKTDEVGGNMTSGTKSELDVKVEHPTKTARKIEAETKDGSQNVKSKVDEKVERKVLTKPEDNYKFEQKQRKKVNQYYKAVKDIPYEKPAEKKKTGRLMKFIQKFIPKRKKNPEALPLYCTDNKKDIALKPISHSQDCWDSSTSTTLDSAIVRQRNADWENSEELGEDKEETDRFRGGTSGGIRNFQQVLSGCNSEETTLSITGKVPSTLYSNQIQSKQVLAKYFINIEDLTPTRDCDIPMTSVDTQKSHYSSNDEVFVRELLPERDVAGISDSNKYLETGVTPSFTSGYSMQASSSSNLSEAFCSSVLGVPCTIKDFAVNNDYSYESTLCAIKGESLIIPEDTTIDIKSKQENRSQRVQASSRITSNPKSERQQNLPDSLSRKQAHSSKGDYIQGDKTRITASPRSSTSSLRSERQQNKLKSSSRDQKQQHSPRDEYTKADRKQSLPFRGKVSQASANCNCETILNRDCNTQTCPNSILKKTTTVIKSPCNISETTIDEMDEFSDKPAETAEKYPVRDSSDHPKTLLTSDKMQQTFDNCVDKPSLDEDSEISQFSHANYCSCQCQHQEVVHTLCTHRCCKCPPPPHRMDDIVSVRGMEYGGSSRRNYPGYAENFPYSPDVVSEFSVRSNQRSPYIPKRYSTEYPSDSGYSQYKGPYSSERSYPQRPKTKQKVGACCGDCACCIKKRKAPKPPPLPQYRSMKYETSSSSESNEDDDYDSYYNEEDDLPYQHGEDYMDLVQELEETLQSRNRNRVRRAMQEFERRSRYNKPLEKPIIDYDQTSESEEPIIQKISQLTSEKQRCCAGDLCTCRREARERIKQDKRNQYKHRAKSKPKVPSRSPQVSQSEGQTHWQMDMVSGEWYKVSGNQHQKFKGRRRSGTPSPQKGCPHDCKCCASRGYDYR